MMKFRRSSALEGFMLKEVRHILRDRQTLLVLLFLPLAMVVIFGFAMRTDVRSVRVLFVDPVPDVATRAIRTRFAGNGRFEIAGIERRSGAIEPAFRRGEADIAVVFSPGFGDDLHAGRRARLLIISDVSDPNTGSLMQAYSY